MSNYDNSNKGAIWANDRKETERHPDYSGSANVDGVEYWISAWKRDANGNPRAPALRFSFQPKEQQAEQPTAQEAVKPTAPSPAPGPAYDDDLPF